MKNKELVKLVEELEHENEEMLKQLAEIDQLMRQVGFSNGLETVKLTAREIYETDKKISDQIDPFEFNKEE